MIHKTTRSILSVLLAALLLVTSVPLTPAFADGGGVSLQSASGESGKLTQDGDDTYLIYTAENLKEFAAIVNGTDSISADSDADARLMNDIDLSSVCSEENGTWTPIGNSSNEYIGTFNGNGHTISGLYIDSSDNDYKGLFGYVGSSGKIEKLSVSGSVSGNRYVGGVVGLNSGIVENCYNIGKVSGNRYVGGVVGYNGTGATVSNCYNTGTITGTDDYVVGVVGYNRGTVKNCHNIGEVSGNRYVGGVVGSNNNGRVENCHNTGSVTGTDDYVGGVVGYNYGSVTNCYNTGSVSGPGNQVGGVVGYNISSVTNCYNTGSVSGTGNQVGGVVGYNDGGRVGGRVENCYNTGEVSGNSYVGGVVGDNSSSGNVTGCYFLQQDPVIPGIGGGYTDRQTAEPVDNLDALCENFKSVTGWETNTILKRPVLKDNHEDDGSEQHPYEIFTAAQLENFRDIVNGPDGNPAAHAVLMENITLNSSEEWTPIGTSSLYSGTFDGNGKTINIYTTADYQGLFGYVYGGTVKNLNVSGTVSNVGAVGGIVNVNSGRVENCTFSGSVKGSGVFVGGVVGNNGGTVTGCIFSGSGSVTGVTGSSYVGGVVGYSSGGASVTNCYNTGDVSGIISAGGVVGRTAAASKTATTPARSAALAASAALWATTSTSLATAPASKTATTPVPLATAPPAVAL